jgi:predicted Zn-dependent protease
MQNILRLSFFIVLLSSLISCSLTKEKTEEIKINVPNEAWWKSALNSKDVAIANLSRVRLNMNAVGSVPYSLGISQQTTINAFATQKNGQLLVVFTKGFLNEFGKDPDVLATTLGHEVAHHYLGHTNPVRQRDRAFAQEAASRIIGTVASLLIPYSGLIVGPTVKAASLSFNRDDEREADRWGMQKALQAGYSPCGSYRFSMRMTELGKDNTITFLSTHPGSTERSENTQIFMKERQLSNCNN